MKILLVEDSKFLRLSTERALSRAGYEVISAADGEEGLRLAREQLPDLILLDLLLPKVSGPDVLKALKLDSTTAAIPVVVMSGLSQRNAARLEKDGAFAFLEKSELALDHGPEPLLMKLESIKKQLAAAAGRK
jgi:CheY-like chemotaxis protein